jgi:hypothetical protein
VKIMGSQKYENVGESQSLLIMNDPIISTRTRRHQAWLARRVHMY